MKRIKLILICLTFIATTIGGLNAAEPTTKLVVYGHEFNLNQYDIREIHITESDFMRQVQRFFPDKEKKGKMQKHELKKQLDSLVKKNREKIFEYYLIVKDIEIIKKEEKMVEPFSNAKNILKDVDDYSKFLEVTKLKSNSIPKKKYEEYREAAIAFDSFNFWLEYF